MNKICAELGLSAIDEFISMSTDELGDMLGEDFDIPELEESWYSADEGISLFETIREHIAANPTCVKNSSAVVDDLDEYLSVLRQAKAIGAQWRLSVDA